MYQLHTHGASQQILQKWRLSRRRAAYREMQPLAYFPPPRPTPRRSPLTIDRWRGITFLRWIRRHDFSPSRLILGFLRAFSACSTGWCRAQWRRAFAGETKCARKATFRRAYDDAALPARYAADGRWAGELFRPASRVFIA